MFMANKQNQTHVAPSKQKEQSNKKAALSKALKANIARRKSQKS